METYYQFEDINNAVIRLFRTAREKYGASEEVLDLGCGRARLGLEIERLGYKVTGIDSNKVACATARTRISEVIELDLADWGPVATALKGRHFDWLMAADVLEHSPDPARVLTFYRSFLKPNGRLILSLPNVVVWDNRLRLLFGRFDYSDSGVMDRTHLRFFTFRTARELVGAAGFTPLRTTWESGIARAFLPTLKPLLSRKGGPRAILDSPVYRFYARYLLPVEHRFCGLAPGLLAFRAVILARVTDCAEEPSNHRSQS
ncbi:MAG TPA: methyltransferase domain-containing protein [Candidatus Binataceae bacterium]|nr:methyltransferase domain-containing protein [Candidatus Binataceae bacterium]